VAMADLIGRKIDIVGFDACLMSMIEVAYQIKDAAELSVGSEESEPNEGWPYDRILKALTSKPSMSPAELAGTITREYLSSYGREEVTLSAANLSALDPLARAIDGLAKKLQDAIRDDLTSAAITTARLRAQEYSPPYDDYCDLIDVCLLISHYVGKPGIASACEEVTTAAAKAIIEHGSRGARMANSHGLSIYFPKKRLCSLYSGLDFARNSAWPAFVSDYLAAATKRPTLG
jgi:hypothetical protein